VDIRSKLRLKPDHDLRCVNLPAQLASLDDSSVRNREVARPALLVFAVDETALDLVTPRVVASASHDGLTWVAHPRSGQWGTDLNRDSLAHHLKERGIASVRQVSLDSVWSALRFRLGSKPT